MITVTDVVRRAGLDVRRLRRARLTVVAGPDRDRAATFDGAPLTVGTEADCSFILADRKVSRRHLEIALADDGYQLRDLGSTNGSFVDGMRFADVTVDRACRLQLGDDHLLVEPAGEIVEVPASSSTRFGSAIGTSARMREVFAVLERVAPTNLSVLVEGETGTGKELLAEGIHRLSARASRPLVVLDCGAVAESLVESELFGHERGAFTDAVSARAGVFESADGGTLFIDEIGELPLALQPKLLRALESGEVRRVGSTHTRKVDVRVVAATNRNLPQAVNSGSFRADLYYRVAAVRVVVPPLRQRREDIPLLVQSFAEQVADELGADLQPLSPSAIARLQAEPWPGNVRELRNAVERLLLAPDLPTVATGERSGSHPSPASALPPYHAARRDQLERFEREYAARLRADFPSLSAAARAAGLDRRSLQRLYRRLDEK